MFWLRNKNFRYAHLSGGLGDIMGPEKHTNFQHKIVIIFLYIFLKVCFGCPKELYQGDFLAPTTFILIENIKKEFLIIHSFCKPVVSLIYV